MLADMRRFVPGLWKEFYITAFGCDDGFHIHGNGLPWAVGLQLCTAAPFDMPPNTI